MYDLTLKDYKLILDFYEISYKNMSNSAIRKNAEEILATKLCRCIKKVQSSRKDKTEGPAIAICNTSLFKKRKLKYNAFTCKNKPRLIPNKKTKKRISKRTRKIKLKKKS